MPNSHSRKQAQELSAQLIAEGIEASPRDVLRLTEFVEQAGGIDAAREILATLEELRSAA